MLNEVERRPIAVRTANWSQWLAFILIKTGLSPNQVSLISIWFAAVGSLMLLLAGQHFGGNSTSCFMGAAICIQLRLLCNMLDGLMAVEGKRSSNLGVMFNEIPDRIADSLFLVLAGCAANIGAMGITLGWAAALLAMFTAYIRAFGAAQGLKQDFSGPCAKPQRMAILTIACLAAAIQAMLNTPITAIAIGLIVILLGTFITCIRRVWHLTKALEAS